MTGVSLTAAWQRLADLAQDATDTHLVERFAGDPDRLSLLTVEAPRLYADFCRQHLDRPIRDALLELAHEREVETGIARMFAGEPVNPTEMRAAAHVALRMPRDAGFDIDGVDVVPDVHRSLDRMFAFCDDLRSGNFRGHGNTRIADVVNIGIGGSDLGPRLVIDALTPMTHGGPNCHFISNYDAAPLLRLLDRLDPAATLFVVASKSFRTAETLANAALCRDWLADGLGTARAIDRHFVAVTGDVAAAQEFGIADENCFEVAAWTGGRFSLWSPVGLSMAISLGMQAFRGLLRGAHAMDLHFRDQPLAENLPVMAALTAIWNRNFLGCATQAVVPYADGLKSLPAYLQQLMMESNGKRVAVTGDPVDVDTAAVIFGDAGTNAQHAFFQALHQGTQVVPVDFILVRDGGHGQSAHQQALIANGLAQAEALMRGRDDAATREWLAGQGFPPDRIDAVAPHASFPGNRQSTTLLLDALTPESLGALLAFYEHQTYVISLVWGINAFDQWGVELGKQVAADILPSLSATGDSTIEDPSTRALIERCRPPAADEAADG